MRSAFLAAVAMAAGGDAPPPAVPPPSARPARVMSMNLCTDQIVLALLPPARIVSVTRLARDPDLSLVPAAARRVGINRGTTEEVVRARPDLVVAGSYTTTATRAMLRRLGWPLLEVAPADSIADIRAVTRQIAAAVGARARGEALIARMDADLARLARQPSRPVRVAAWDGGGFAAGPGSLYDLVLKSAGAVNVGADPRAQAGGPPDTERLLAVAPSLIVQGGRWDRVGARANTAYHPLVRRIWGERRTLTLRPAAYICGTPLIAAAIAALRSQIREKDAIARTPPPFGLLR